MCPLYRLKASRAPAKTCYQARPSFVSERVSHGGEGHPQGCRGVLASLWRLLAPPGGHGRHRLGAARLGSDSPMALPFLRPRPTPPPQTRYSSLGQGGWGVAGRGGLCTHSWSEMFAMLLWSAAGTHHPTDPQFMSSVEQGPQLGVDLCPSPGKPERKRGV